MTSVPKILIVEDNAIVAADIKARIQRMGYKVTDCVAMGERAVESVKISPPDLILMDIKLKGDMNGVEAATIIRKSHDIPVVYITSYSDEQTLANAKKTDPFGYIIKPFEDKELRIIIELSIHKHTSGKQLKESEQWLKTTLKSIGDGVIATDMNRAVTFMNRVAENLTGWTLADAKGLPITEVFHIINEYTGQIVKNPVTKVIETGQIVGLANHTLLIAKDGRRLPIKDSGSPIALDGETAIGVVLVFQDDSKSRAAEKELKASEEKFKTLFDHAPLPYQSLDADGRFLEVNQTWLQHLGYQKEDVKGKSFADFLKPEWRDHFAVNFPKFKSIGEVLGVEFELLRKDGTYLNVQFDGKTSSDTDGNFIKTHCVFRDITQEIKLKKQLKAQENALRHQQKLEAIGTLAGGIAHDFNNILSAIMGFTELSLDEAGAGTELRDNLDEVYSASMRAKNLVNQILTFSRDGEEIKKTINMGFLVRDTLNMLRATTPSFIELVETVDDDSITVHANSTQLYQVLMNLITNAVYAIETNGTISIGLKKEQIDGKELKTGEIIPTGDYAQIVVSDTGVGIAKEHLLSIFDPYFSTKPQGKGSGLGLSVVHGIIASHDGHISVSSELGVGTTFTIYLPLSSQEEVSSTTEDVGSLPCGSERILVVDDEPQVVKIYHRHLVKFGYTVTIDFNSNAALERFRQSPDQFDLVLTDMAMPSMTGLELAKKIKDIRQDIPVLLCTGFSEEISLEGPLPDQLDGILIKPVEKGTLIPKVRELLDAN